MKRGSGMKDRPSTKITFMVRHGPPEPTNVPWVRVHGRKRLFQSADVEYEEKRMAGAPACGKQAAQYTDKQPDEGSDAPFAAALEAILGEDRCRTWAAGRTIILRRTSKRVKDVVDKMRLPAVVRLSRSFWNDAHNGTAAEKLQIVMRQLALMTGWSPHSSCRSVKL